MSGHIDNATEALSTLGSWQPENATDINAFLERLPEVTESLGSAISSIADTLGSDNPVDVQVADKLREIASAIAGTSDLTAEAHSTFRSAHEDDLNRLENPRPGEELWDQQSN